MKRGFTIIELLVTLAIIAILAAVGVAVMSQVMANSKSKLTQAELDDLAMMDTTLVHKVGIQPVDMTQFLQAWQSLHCALIGKPQHWVCEPSTLNKLPGVQYGLINAPGSPVQIKGVVAIDDAWGRPIVLHNGVFQSAGYSGKMGNADNLYSH